MLSTIQNLNLPIQNQINNLKSKNLKRKNIFSDTSNKEQNVKRRINKKLNNKNQSTTQNNQINEEWKSLDCINCPNYKISNYGKIKNQYDRLIKSKKCVILVTKNNKKKSVRIARLVLLAFLGEPPTENHHPLFIDNDKNNFYVKNLRWSSPIYERKEKIKAVKEKALGGLEYKPLDNLGYIGYKVSNIGLVRNKRNVLLSQHSRGGYKLVNLVHKDKGPKGSPVLVHTLVAFAFLGSAPSDKHTIDHIDQNGSHNNVSNLRYALPSQQRQNQGERENTSGMIVIKMDSNKNVLQKYKSVSEAYRSLDLKNGEKLVKVCGKDIEYQGFYWKFYDPADDNPNYIWKKVPLEGIEMYAGCDGCLKWNNRLTYGSIEKKDPKGYLSINIKIKGKSKGFYVHTLCALAFLGPAPNEPNIIVNHKNSNKQSNDFTNLEYITKSQNTIHAYENGFQCKIFARPVRQYKDGVFIKEFISASEVENILGINSQNIAVVCSGNRNSTAGFQWCYADADFIQTNQMDTN